MRMALRVFIVLVILLYAAAGAAGPAAVTAVTLSFAGSRFDVVTVDLRRARLRLFYRDQDGRPYSDFATLAGALSHKGQRLLLATNAGIFEPGYVPTGLLVIDGQVLHPLNLAAGTGNFYLRPNGVFLLDEHGAAIVESSRFTAVAAKAREATQSGPLLVIQGALHPAFRADSESRKIRNGIGVLSPERIVLAISDDPVNFWTFAELFRKHLGCRDALYLDGTISGLYAPALSRDERGKGPYAAIIGVTAR